MDGFEIYASQANRRARDEGPGAPRSFLFLQGPISGFFDRLARALIARGHRVHRVNLHFGDRLFWRLPATDYRGRFAEWRGFVADLLERHQVTDLVLHGDRRPYHIIAAEEARARGIAVITTDLGYVRPDWLTLEHDGMTTYSRFPRDRAAIFALADEFDAPELGPRFRTPFWLIAVTDIAYNLGLAFGRPLYPHYRYHSVCHPFLEYAGWIASRPKKFLTARATAAAKHRLQEAPGSYFLVPLQLQTDFQIRAHSPFDDLREAVGAIVASFAESASQRRLAFIVHPLDNGLIGWHRLIMRLGRRHGVADRVLALHGGTPNDLLRNAAGVVTINSTVGLAALQVGVPVKALGNAVFDVPGLTSQSPLDAFWHDPQPPEAELLSAFLRALIGTTQVKGGYYERSAQECAIAGVIERLERRPYPLPPLAAADFAARPPREPSRTVVVAGVSNGIGLALARAHAAPGMRLCLIGANATMLEQAALDCQHRGALVETFCPTDGTVASVGSFLAGLDERSPIDALVVQVDAAAESEETTIDHDIAAAIGLVAALAEPMRRRGGGDVVLLSSLAGQTATAALGGALRARRSLLAHGATLRRQLSVDGVAVTVVVPSSLAMRAAAWFEAPRIAVVGAERIGEAIAGGVHRHRAAVAVPGAGTAAMRATRLVFSRVRAAVGSDLAWRAEPVAESGDVPPLARESVTGD